MFYLNFFLEYRFSNYYLTVLWLPLVYVTMLPLLSQILLTLVFTLLVNYLLSFFILSKKQPIISVFSVSSCESPIPFVLQYGYYFSFYWYWVFLVLVFKTLRYIIKVFIWDLCFICLLFLSKGLTASKISHRAAFAVFQRFQ